MTEKRKVAVYKWYREKGNYFSKFPDGNGIFLQFGIDYQELDNGVGTFSTVIIERPDGSIENLPVELVAFNDD